MVALEFRVRLSNLVVRLEVGVRGTIRPGLVFGWVGAEQLENIRSFNFLVAWSVLYRTGIT